MKNVKYLDKLSNVIIIITIHTINTRVQTISFKLYYIYKIDIWIKYLIIYIRFRDFSRSWYFIILKYLYTQPTGDKFIVIINQTFKLSTKRNKSPSWNNILNTYDLYNIISMNIFGYLFFHSQAHKWVVNIIIYNLRARLIVLLLK